MNLTELPAVLAGVTDETPSGDLPRLIGDLEAAKAHAWARLTVPAANVTTGQPPEENVSAKEAARRLGVSPDYLYKQAKADRLPFVVHIGRRVLFDARGLDRWKRHHTTKAA